MSSRDNDKRPPGHFHRGRGNNRGKSPHPPTSSKSEAKGNPKHSDNVKNKPQTGNKGKKNTNPNLQTVDGQQRNNPNQGAFSFQHNLTSFESGTSTGFHPNQSLNANFTQISINLQNFGPQVNLNNPSLQPRDNARRGHARRPPNVNQPIPLPPRAPEAPTEIRVFTGSRESNEPKTNFRQMSPNNRGNFFHQPRGFNPAHAQNNRPRFLLQTPSPVRNLNPQQYNTFQNQNQPRGFHPAHTQNNRPRFQTPSPVRNLNPQLYNTFQNQNQPRGFHPAHTQNNRPRFQTPSPVRNLNPQQYNTFQNHHRLPHSNPIFFQTSAKENVPNNPQKFDSNKATSYPPANIQGVHTYKYTRAPVFKFKKKPQIQTAGSQSNLNSDRQVPQVKIEKQGPQAKIEKQGPRGKVDRQRSHNRKKRPNKKPNLWKKKTPVKAEAAPLFSFQRISNESESKSKDSASEEEGSTSMSRCSSEESVWTTNISDDDIEDSLSDESEVASEVTSEISVSSSIRSSAVSESFDSKSSFVPKVDGFISVFWDIENCPVPREKSAVDFVKRIRTKFYEGRTEANFYVVCDVTNLSSILTDELNLADATVIHMSSTNKNAADTKISSLLLEFRDSYKGGNSAIVLVSGDSDFSTILNNLHYKFHVHINLICKDNARHSLIEAAQNCIFYEEFIKDLPSRAKSDSLDYIIIISNYSKNLTLKKVKTLISDKLKGVNCRVRKNDDSSIAVVFPDQCARDRALTLLKGFSIDGSEVRIVCSETKKETITKKEKKKEWESMKEETSVRKGESMKEETSVKEKEIMKERENLNEKESADKKEKKKRSKKSEETVKSSENKNDTNSKGATLWVCVNVQLGDTNYWTVKLEELWSSTDFTLQWEGSLDHGMFLVNFKSLSQAQKAKKILQKAQQTDSTSPKFLKLIKQGGISNNLFSITRSIKDINKSKLEEHVQIIENKKEACLKKHKESVKELSDAPTPSVPEAAEAKAAKFNELNEQKVTFLNFTQNIIEQVKAADLECEFIDDFLALYLRDYSRECNCLSTALPIYAKKNAILKKIKKHQVVIIRAETGSGKSTQLTQYIWREDLSQKGLVICTQPRKIAAITLAKHVSSQVGYSLGEVVGYQVGLNAKRSENTAILYVTDFTMLKMIVNNDLKDVSCIIVDEAHERTVYTDLLLGMIKSCLKSKPELKLIITSATIDTSVFKIYLGLTDDAILEVSGRTFPVEDVWLDKEVALGWDYFQRTIDTACDILNQEPGDILAFLTTPFETEKAVKVFSEKIGGKRANTIRIHQLHGKLDVQEQQKVFERTPNGIRKVVFATNCAETSVTIPGIRYVVDCGMVKESQYDAIRNMNVLSVNFVSQSSAEQRRGRAGRTQVGKCYRLYSRKNYDSMEKTSVPEILRVNLGQAVLRLMKIGVKDPLQFDFVQSPPKESLNLTMKQLTNLNAVSKDDLSLTQLGESMSCLPLEPRLSFLVLTGIELDVGYEAVVLAALVTISRNIFFRTAENKSAADVKKMRFCQSESDFLTFFEVYKEWATVPKQAKSKWCTLNCINARSLRTAQDLVNELMTILEREIKIKVATKFNDISVSDTLLELVFRSFYQNICVFSGYSRFGYRSVDVSGDLLIHPSSSLYTYGNWRPQFLVYDTILQTNQTYLINVSPVTEEAIQVCMERYGIEIDLEALKSMALTAYAMSPLGKTILLHDIIGKQGIKKRELESQLKSLIGTDQLAVEADVQKGEVKVHGPHSKYDEISSILCPLIEKGRERLSLEEKEVFIYPELCAIISSGIAIRDVVLPGEFRDIKVTLSTDSKINSVDGKLQAVVEKLQAVGPVCTAREWKNYYKITFFSPVHAELALEKFKSETDFTLQKIIKSNALDGRLNQYKVFVSFMRRECTGIAFVTIDPPTSLNNAYCILSLHTISFQNCALQCSVSKKSQDLRFTNLPPDTDNREFEKFLSSYIPTDSKISKCVVVRKKEYESTPVEVENIKQSIIQQVSEFTSKEKFSVDLRKPYAKAVRWNAYVFFQNACHGETAVKILKSRAHTSFTGLQMKPSLQTSLYCKLQVYYAIKNQVEEALKFFKDNCIPGNTLEISGYPKEGGVQIHITSNNISDISDARKSILTLILGDQLAFKSNAMEKLFSATGREHLKNMSRDNCYIDLNTYKKVITIFGDVSASNVVKLEINEFLDLLEEEHMEEINLMPDTGRPGVLRLLLSKYGHGLDELMKVCDLTGIEVNSYRHILTVKGSSSSVSKCHDIITDLKEKLEENEYPADTEQCPVCFDKVSDNHHRLEYCGHPYCRECVLHWFQNATDFPLNCITCGDSVVLADVQWATKEVKSFETEMFKKALMAFIQSRNDVSYCPTPDCPMIFRISTNGTIFDCPLCNNSICTQCKELNHFGMSCSLYQCCKEDNDYSLKVWMSENPSGRKMCPACSAPIEKDGGCNHMTCWKCQCHMCWLCLEVFPTGDHVYIHQSSCPKLAVSV